jgi:hypothetical protein
MVSSVEDLLGEVDLVVSIVVPSAAKEVAARIASALRKSGRSGLLFMDANAISPMTAESLNGVISAAGAQYVDGCIIGGAAKMDQGTIVYVSGPEASRIEALNASGLRVEVLGPGPTQASAFKIIHAGLSKGLAGLFTELLVGAEALGLLDITLKDYERSYPGLDVQPRWPDAGRRSGSGKDSKLDCQSQHRGGGTPPRSAGGGNQAVLCVRTAAAGRPVAEPFGVTRVRIAEIRNHKSNVIPGKLA